MREQTRRQVIKTIIGGAAYVAPVIATIAAPARLMAQGTSGMMYKLCDYWPWLCCVFDPSYCEGATSSQTAPVTAPGQQQAPGAQPAPGSQPAPGQQPAPWQTAPAPGTDRRRQ
jgi:hypothetical protein